MSDSSAGRNPVEVLAEEFVARKRRGEHPTLAEYTEKHPHLADEIRELFPALMTMEDLRPDSGDMTAEIDGSGKVAAGPKLEKVGDYRILREIGRGGMGVVYEAEQESLGRRVAVKVLAVQASKDEVAMERFRREARAAAKLHHTNIVPVFEVGQDGDVCYYAMQFIQGEALDEVLGELRRLRARSAVPPTMQEPNPKTQTVAMALCIGEFTLREQEVGMESGGGRDGRARAATAMASGEAGAQSPAGSTVRMKLGDTSSASLPGRSDLSVVESNYRNYFHSVGRIGHQVADALVYAHARGIIHRDIKPSNLLLDGAGVVWVTDFGLAKTEDDELTRTGDILGTMRYMSPERFRGECDVRGDVYALGITLYELLVLRPAFESSDRLRLVELISKVEPPRPRAVDPRIPRDLETIVLKAIDKDPRHRYQTAWEMAEDLRRFLEDRTILARRASPLERLARWCRRNPAVAFLTCMVAVLLISSSILSLLAARHFEHLAGEKEHARAQEEHARAAAEFAKAEALENLREARDQRRRAQANFRLARDAVDQYLTRVSESTLLNVPGLQPLRKELLESALGFYQEFAEQHADDPSLQSDLAMALTRMGRITGEIGSPSEALKSYQQALTIRKDLLAADPDNEELQVQIARHHDDLARLQMQLGDLQAADAACAAAETIWGGLDSGDPVFQSALASTLQTRSEIADRDGNSLRALENLNSALGIQSKVVADHRDHPNIAKFMARLATQFDQFANLHVKHGLTERLHSSLGILSGVEELYRRSHTLLQELVEEHSEHERIDDFRRALASNLENTGDLLKKQGPTVQALEPYAEALLVRSRLARDNPVVTDYQAELSRTHARIGEVYAKIEQWAKADASFERAIERQRVVVYTTPGVPAHVAVLARQLSQLAAVRARLGNPAAALVSYREALKLLRSQDDPQADDFYALAVAGAECFELPAHAQTEPAGDPPAQPPEDTDPDVKLLREAVAEVFLDFERLKTGTALDSPKPVEDVQSLLDDLHAMVQVRQWNGDLEAARAQATREDKDLLIYFSGSDWCNWCMFLKEGVFDNEVFLKEACKHYVLVQLDSPRHHPKPKNFESNEQLRHEWNVTSYPTVILADANLRRFAKPTRNRPNSALGWVERLAELHELRVAFKEDLDKAEDAEGAEKVQHLTAALERVSEEYVFTDYKDLLAEIAQLDPDRLDDYALQHPRTVAKIWIDLGQARQDEGQDELAEDNFGRAMVILQQRMLIGVLNTELLTTDEILEPLRSREDFKLLLAAKDKQAYLPYPAGQVRQFAGHGRGPNGASWAESVAGSPDGRFALSAGNDETLRLWDVETGEEVRRFELDLGPVYDVAFFSDGRRALASGGKGICLFDVETGKEIRRLVGHSGKVFSIAVSPDQRRALSGGGSMRLWDVETGEELHRFRVTAGACRCVAFSPDGRRALAGGSDGFLRLWDLQTFEELQRLEGHQGTVWCAAFSPDGTRALSCGSDETVRLWDLDSGEELRLLEGHQNQVRGLTFFDDGRRCLSGDKHGFLILWDLETGRKLHRFQAPPSGGHLSVAPLPGGRRLLTSGEDSSVRLWLVSEDGATAGDLARVGRTDAAAEAYATAAQSRPEDRDLKIEQARFLGRWGRWEEADAAYAELAESSSDGVRLLTEQALARARYGEYDKAAALFDKSALAGNGEAPLWFRTGWWVVGPYPKDLQVAFPPEADPDPLQPVAGPDTSAATFPVELHWHPVRQANNGRLNLKAVFGRDNISAYALLQVYCPQQQDVAILLGSDDSMRFWVNGKLLHEYPRGRKPVPDDDAVAATLSPGWNTLLAKVVNYSFGHDLYLRISDQPLDLARAYNGSRQWDEALKQWDLALKSNPDDDQLWLGRARTYVELGRDDEAERDFAKVAELRSDGDPPVLGRIRMYTELAKQGENDGDLAGAISWYTRAIELKADDRDLIENRGHLYARSARWQEALADFSRALELDPSDNLDWHRNAVLYLETGDVQGYRRHCREMVDRFSASPGWIAAGRLCKACLIAADAVDDREMLAKLVEESLSGPESSDLRKFREVTKGMAEYRDGRFENAIQWLRKSLGKNPERRHPHVMAYVFMAMAMHQSGRSDDAQQSLDMARHIIQQYLPKIADGDLGRSEWHDWLYCRIAYREARELLGADPKSDTPAASPPAPPDASGEPAASDGAP